MFGFRRTVVTAFVSGLMLALSSAAAARPTPLGTAFNYQGQLKQGGTPVNALADFEFSLFDAAVAGTPVGTMQAVNAVDIVEGLFQVSLDFGAGVFGNDERWLQIAVRSPAGGGTFTTLSPRQRIQPAPMAQFALSVDGPSITNLNASNITTGMIANAQTTGSAANAANSLVLRDASGNFVANTITATGFSGSGAALTNLNASNLANGNLAAARLPTGGAWSLTSNLNLDANTLVVDPVNNRVGIGTSPTVQALEVFGSSGPAVTSGSSSNGIMRIKPSSTNTILDIGGTGSPSAHTWLQSRNATDYATNFNLALNPNGGNVGIGTASPSVSLHVAGLGRFSGTGGFSIGSDGSQMRIDSGGASTQHFRFLDSNNQYAGVRVRQASIGGNYGDTNAPTDGMIVQGRVGIGLNSPGNALEVAGVNSPAHVFGSNENSIIRVRPTGTAAILDIGGTGSPAHAWLQSRDAGNYLTNYTLALNPNGGNVGIGTTSPTGRLHVFGPADTTSVVLPNNAISAPEIADEPGLASFRRSDGTDLSINSTASSYGLRTINCPADGHVLAIVSAWLIADSGEFARVRIGASLNSTSLSNTTWANSVNLEDFNAHNVTIQSVIPVSAGSTTFHIVAVKDGINVNARMRDPRMTLIYLPSAYGLVITD